MPVIDIFIKTYAGDYVFLDYALRSIQKFVTGYRKVIIVCDSQDPPYIPKVDIPFKVHSADIIIGNSSCHLGVGYIWAQNIKLNCFHFSDADAMFHVDSDMMFSDFFDVSKGISIDNRWKWFYKTWEEDSLAEINSKEATDCFIKQSTMLWYQPSIGFMFDKFTSQKFLEWTDDNWGGTWEYLTKQADSFWKNGKVGSNEYLMYGSFMHFYCPQNYFLVHNSQWDLPMYASWSWGGLNDAPFRESLLNI